MAAFRDMDTDQRHAHACQGEPVTSDSPLAARLDGLLFFPVTAYTPDGAVDLAAFRAHVRGGIDAGAAAVFACCGTGEFHALTPEEFADCVAAAVEETAGRVPVIAGAGYGTALALRFARLAHEAGADGLLAMPPYLVAAGQRGLLRHYTALAAATPSPSSSTSATTPSSHRPPSSRWPGPRASSASRTGWATSTCSSASSAPSAPRPPTRTSSTSTACPPPNSPAPPTSAWASAATPPPSSPSPPRSPSPSTGR